MDKRCIIPYTDALSLFEDADILLFRGNSWISYLIKKASSGYYSHAAITSWNRDENGKKLGLEVLEYREFIGSRASSFKNYIEKNSGLIDVYRAYPVRQEMSFDCDKYIIKTQLKKIDTRAIVNEFRELTGLPYGYRAIWEMAKRQIVFLRWFNNPDYFEDDRKMPKYPVCSTVIAYLYQKYYSDLLKYQSTAFMSPSSLAQSPLLSYMFTITKDLPK